MHRDIGPRPPHLGPLASSEDQVRQHPSPEVGRKSFSASDEEALEARIPELKTHHRGPRYALHSKTPNLVIHEIWDHLCRHYGVRSLMLDRPRGRFPPLAPPMSPDGYRSRSDL